MIPGRTHVIISLSAVCLLVAGCGGTTTESEKQVSFESGGMTHTFSEGEKSVPAVFPLPLYPGAEATGSVQALGANEESKFVVLQSKDSVETIRKYYEDELKKQQWTIKVVVAKPNMAIMTGTKGNLQTSISVNVGDKKSSTISLNVSQEPEGVPKVTNQNYTPDKLNPPTD